MNLKNTIAGAALGASLLTGCKNEAKQYEDLPVDTSVTIPHAPERSAATYSDQLTDLLSASDEETYVINMDRVRKGPLGTMKKLGHNMRTLLGGKYADSIMQQYNQELLDTLILHNPKIAEGSVQWVGYEKYLNDIKVPMTYPTLENFFDPSLEVFLSDKPEIAEQVGDDKEVIIITRNIETKEKKDGSIDTAKKHVIGYYVDGKRVLGQYMSAGVGKDLFEMDYRLNQKRRIHAYTKPGVYYTNYNIERGHGGDKKDSVYYSGSFKSAMPYAIPIDDNEIQDGVFLHTGVADGMPRSHQCNRLPGWVAMWFYDNIGDKKVKVVIDDLYDKKEEEKVVTKRNKTKKKAS